MEPGNETRPCFQDQMEWPWDEETAEFRELPSVLAAAMQSAPAEDHRAVAGPQQPKVNFLKAVLEAHVVSFRVAS